MDRFRNSGADVHTTILLGAGASTTSGLPDWDTFATRLLLQSRSVLEEETAKLLLSRQDPLIVVEAARVAFGKKWEPKLRNALYDGVSSLDPSPLHLAAVGHFLAGKGEDSSLVTLNFDTLLEEAIQGEMGCEAIAVVDAEPHDSAHAVHHLHGVITPTRTESVILTLSDFTSLIAASDSWQSEYFRSALSRGALVIAGTSYRDPDVRQWLHAAVHEHRAENSAFVLLAREGFAVSKEDFKRIEIALSDQWKAVGLTPVLLQDHSDAAQIIRELRHFHGDDYQSPQERAVEVWHRHSRDFDELQLKYVERLEVGAATMKEALDVMKLNLTLWLSDGEGRLARWAAQDRLYRDFDALRTVETGHDSPWIAGRALGADALLFQDLDHDGTKQWKSVLAIPVPVRHPNFPTLSSAVLTIGLPDSASRFESSNLTWGPPLAELADELGSLLSSVAFGESNIE